MRRPGRFYSLQRPKIRQSWNKYNLYNIARFAGREPRIQGTPTFFQQKWTAKSKTRGYHGEHIPEKKWVRLFSRRLLSAVDMPPQYLAAFDGSEQAAGRGSGLSNSKVTASRFSRAARPSSEMGTVLRKMRGGDVNELLSQQFNKMTPYMQMTFAPLERRLDTAVFRALFASSVRQARQFVIHGAVKVNGKKMVHPSYQLNPGDMFQVEVDKVLLATGQQRPTVSSGPIKKLRQDIAARRKRIQAVIARAISGRTAEAEESEEQDGSETSSTKKQGIMSPIAELKDESAYKGQKELIDILRRDVRNLIRRDKAGLDTQHQTALLKSYMRDLLQLPAATTAQLLSELRLFIRNHDHSRYDFETYALEADKPESEARVLPSSRRTAKKSSSETPQPAESTEAVDAAEPTTEKSSESVAGQDGKPVAEDINVVRKSFADLGISQKKFAGRFVAPEKQLFNDQYEALEQIMRKHDTAPVDSSKPYLTPWAPRPEMAAFAFIPRYLEVNPNICAAVYLRHPVARKGLGEVPTPFSYLTNQLSHNWYLRRR